MSIIIYALTVVFVIAILVVIIAAIIIMKNTSPDEAQIDALKKILAEAKTSNELIHELVTEVKSRAWSAQPTNLRVMNIRNERQDQ
jgi:hypothetical protein